MSNNQNIKMTKLTDKGSGVTPPDKGSGVTPLDKERGIMPPLDNAIKNIIEYASDKRVVASVSGGADSMCLLSLLLSNKDKLQSLSVIAFDHKIRPQSSVECEFVQSYCNAHDIECEIYTKDIVEESKKTKQSVELVAREWRMSVCKQLHYCDMIALGHHMDDQVETILFKLFRGAGLQGVGGMDVLSSQNLFRPLLQTPKSAILEYCKQNSIPFVNDASNDEIDYDRNFIRHCIVPKIKERWDVSNICEFGQIARNTKEYLVSQIDESVIERESNGIALQLSVLQKFNNFEYIVYALSYLDASDNFDTKAMQRICTLQNLQSGKYVDVCNGLVARREFDQIKIFKVEKKAKSQSVPFCGVGHYCIDGQGIEVHAAKYKFENKCGRAVNNSTFRYNPLHIDIDKIPEGSVFRHRQIGDEFVPFGGKHTTLKKYYINKKVPLNMRDTDILLAHNNQILCIVGMEISDTVKVENGSKAAKILLD